MADVQGDDAEKSTETNSSKGNDVKKSTETNFYEAPNSLNYEKIHENAATKAKNRVNNLKGKLLPKYEKSRLLKTNQIFELELVAEEMYKNLYLRDGFYQRAAWLQTEIVKNSKQIGKLQGGLKFWEGGKFTWEEFTNSFFQWVLKAGMSFLTVLSTASINEFVHSIDQDLFLWLAVFSSISLVELTSASIYNLFTSEPSSKPSNKPIVLKLGDGKIASIEIPYLSCSKIIYILLMVVIWGAEACIGYSMLSVKIAYELGRESNPAQTSEVHWYELLIGVSMFALINLLFAYSKATRDNAVTERKDKLGYYLEYQENLKKEFEYCEKQAKARNADYQKYKNRFIKIIYAKPPERKGIKADFLSRAKFILFLANPNWPKKS